jgi:transmembrane sensor
MRSNTTASPDSAVLGPGQRGWLAPDGSATAGTVVVDSVNPQRYLSWTTGTLTLDDIPLREAVPILERWFDIELRLADSTLADRRVTAVYRDQPLSQVLDALAIALGARYERNAGNTRAVTFFAVRRGS